MNRPRTSPLQKIPSRQAKSKHALKSKLSVYSIPGYDTIPGYVNSMHPKADVNTKKVMAYQIRKHLDATGEMPSISMCNMHLFKGLV